MSAALALILLAEAATSCAPADAPRLAGGATLVRPVGKAEPLPLERLGPAEGLTRSDAVHQVAAEKKTDQPDAEPATETCEAPIHFV